MLTRFSISNIALAGNIDLSKAAELGIAFERDAFSSSLDKVREASRPHPANSRRQPLTR